MGTATKYYNTESALTRIVAAGGSVTVAIATNVGQGNGGTSLACKGCYVVAQAGNTSVIKMNIDTAASASLGIEVPESTGGTGIYVPIDDISKLYFYGATNGDDVDVLYFT